MEDYPIYKDIISDRQKGYNPEGNILTQSNSNIGSLLQLQNLQAEKESEYAENREAQQDIAFNQNLAEIASQKAGIESAAQESEQRRLYTNESLARRKNVDFGISSLVDKVNLFNVDGESMKDNNFYLESPEKYKSNEKIKQLFTKEGKFDEPLFNKWYSEVDKQVTHARQVQFFDNTFKIEGVTDSRELKAMSKPSQHIDINRYMLNSNSGSDISLTKHLYNKKEYYRNFNPKLSINHPDNQKNKITYDPNSSSDYFRNKMLYGGGMVEKDKEGNVFLRAFNPDEDTHGRNVFGLTGLADKYEDGIIGGTNEFVKGAYNGGLGILAIIPQIMQITGDFTFEMTGSQGAKRMRNMGTFLDNMVNQWKVSYNEGANDYTIGKYSGMIGEGVGQMAGIYATAGLGAVGLAGKVASSGAKMFGAKNFAHVIDKALKSTSAVKTGAGAIMMATMNADELYTQGKLAGIEYPGTLALSSYALYLPLNYLVSDYLFGGKMVQKGLSNIGILNTSKIFRQEVGNEFNRLTPLLKTMGSHEVDKYAKIIVQNSFQKLLTRVTNPSGAGMMVGQGTEEGVESLVGTGLKNLYNVSVAHLSGKPPKSLHYFKPEDVKINPQELFDSFIVGAAVGGISKAGINYSETGSIFQGTKETEEDKVRRGAISLISNESEYNKYKKILQDQIKGVGKNMFYMEGIDINGNTIKKEDKTISLNQEIAQNILDNLELTKQAFDTYKAKLSKEDIDGKGVFQAVLKTLSPSRVNEVFAVGFNELMKDGKLDLEKINASGDTKTANDVIKETVKSNSFKKAMYERTLMLANFIDRDFVNTEGFYKAYKANNEELKQSAFNKVKEKVEGNSNRINGVDKDNKPTQPFEFKPEDWNETDNIPVLNAQSKTLFEQKVNEYYEGQKNNLDGKRAVEIGNEVETLKNEIETLKEEISDKNEEGQEYAREGKIDEADNILKEVEKLEVNLKNLETDKANLETEESQIIDKLKKELTNIELEKNDMLSKVNIATEDEFLNLQVDEFFGEELLKNIQGKTEDKNFLLSDSQEYAKDVKMFLLFKKAQLEVINRIGKDVNELTKSEDIEDFSPTVDETTYNAILEEITKIENALKTMVEKAVEKEKDFQRSVFNNEITIIGDKLIALQLIKGDNPKVEVLKNKLEQYKLELESSPTEATAEKKSLIDKDNNIYITRKEVFNALIDAEESFRNTFDDTVKDQAQKEIDGAKTLKEKQKLYSQYFYLNLISKNSSKDITKRILNNANDVLFPSFEQIFAVQQAYMFSVTEDTSIGVEIKRTDIDFTPIDDLQIIEVDSAGNETFSKQNNKDIYGEIIDARVDNAEFNNIYVIEGLEGTGKTQLLQFLDKLIQEDIEEGLNNGIIPTNATYYAPKPHQVENLKSKIGGEESIESMKERIAKRRSQLFLSSASIPSLPTFKKIPKTVSSKEEADKVKEDVFNMLKELVIGQIIETGFEDEFEVVTDKTENAKGEISVTIVKFQRLEDGSIREISDPLISMLDKNGKLHVDYSPHIHYTDLSGNRQVKTATITNKSIDLSKEKIVVEEKGKLVESQGYKTFKPQPIKYTQENEETKEKIEKEIRELNKLDFDLNYMSNVSSADSKFQSIDSLNLAANGVKIIDEYTLIPTDKWIEIMKSNVKIILVGDRGQSTINQSLKIDTKGDSFFPLAQSNILSLQQRGEFTVFRRFNTKIRESIALLESGIDNGDTPIVLGYQFDESKNIGIKVVKGKKDVKDMYDASPLKTGEPKGKILISSIEDINRYQGMEFSEVYIDLDVPVKTLKQYNKRRVLKALLSSIGRASGKAPKVIINETPLARYDITFFKAGDNTPHIDNKDTLYNLLREKSKDLMGESEGEISNIEIEQTPQIDVLRKALTDKIIAQTGNYNVSINIDENNDTIEVGVNALFPFIIPSNTNIVDINIYQGNTFYPTSGVNNYSFSIELDNAVTHFATDGSILSDGIVKGREIITIDNNILVTIQDVDGYDTSASYLKDQIKELTKETIEEDIKQCNNTI